MENQRSNGDHKSDHNKNRQRLDIQNPGDVSACDSSETRRAQPKRHTPSTMKPDNQEDAQTGMMK